ncbi:MAG TPA: hypothetical protein ENH99_01335 [Candidatus Pacearchaeota archaeon]|nr:hypothetical protein [Candidatus Pacearchaeota archaeon]
MDFLDLFKPFSPEIRGELEEYLKDCASGCADNLFQGTKYFFIIKDKGLMIPDITFVRVNQSPSPDVGYFVNSDYLLESGGQGQENMSLVGAKKGVYDPNDVLKDLIWSIYGLNLWDESSTSE